MKYKEINKEKRIETLATISLGILVFGLILKKDEEIIAKWSILITLCSLFTGLFIPFIAKPITWLWYKLSELLGFFMSKVILGSFFYLILFPFSALYRIFNADSLNLRKKKDSYYTDRNIEYSSKEVENPW